MNKNKLFWILLGLAIADFLGAIDSTGINVALPTITRDLSIPISVSQWIPNIYTLILVSTLIFWGKVGDQIGPKKLYIIGLSIFGITSLALGLSNNAVVIIILRAIQGLSTAILYTMPMAIIAHLWKDREKAFAVTASFFAGGMLVGPLIGGVLTGLEVYGLHGWHLLFLLNIPFVIFGLIVAQKFIPVLPQKPAEKYDFLSIVLFLSGLSMIVLSLTLISTWFLPIGLLLIILLYFYEKNQKQPLLDFQLFKNRTFLAANIISFCTMVAVIGMSFILTFYLQDTLGWSSTMAGLAFLPVPIFTGIFAGIGGQIKDWRLGGFLTSVLLLVGMLALTQLSPSRPYYQIILPAMILISAGSGILMSTLFAAILGSAPTDKSGTASGFLNTLQQLGSLIGIALIAGLVVQYRLSFSILAIFTIFGVVAAFFMQKKASNADM
ncbi:MAG: MFS transporter [Candidatus Berkelbacteria bacterium]